MNAPSLTPTARRRFRNGIASRSACERAGFSSFSVSALYAMPKPIATRSRLTAAAGARSWRTAPAARRRASTETPPGPAMKRKIAIPRIGTCSRMLSTLKGNIAIAPSTARTTAANRMNAPVAMSRPQITSVPRSSAPPVSGVSGSDGTNSQSATAAARSDTPSVRRRASGPVSARRSSARTARGSATWCWIQYAMAAVIRAIANAAITGALRSRP